MQERLKSKVVWLSVLGQLLLITGFCMPWLSDGIKIVGGAAIEILTLFGILNNPTNKDGF